jgi:ribosomal protein S11
MAVSTRAKVKKRVVSIGKTGQAHIKATYNNIIIDDKREK